MEELVNVVNNQVVVSSRQVAKLFNRRHDHIIRDIENILRTRKDVPGVGEMFVEGTEPDVYGRSQRSFIISKKGFFMLVMCLNDDALKFKYMDIFEKMEKALMEKEMNKFNDIIPKTYPDALRLAAEYVEKCEKQEKLLIEAKPKVEFFEAVMESNDMLKMAEVAKVLNFKGLGRNGMFEVLREKKILRYNNEPYQAYVDKGYFKQIESKYENEDFTHINLTTVVSQKGLDFIRNVLLKAGYVYLKGGKEIAVNS